MGGVRGLATGGSFDGLIAALPILVSRGAVAIALLDRGRLRLCNV